jgi:hypothetical protein
VPDNKDFEASSDSDSRRTPIRVAFLTERTSPHVRLQDDDRVMTNPEALLRVAVAVIALLIALVLASLIFDAPLEGLADPLQTSNPAKAPWYFLGLQELLHYFPPVVAGVLIPTLVVLALIVIPYFGINIEAEGFWISGRQRKMRILAAGVIVLVAFLMWFSVYAVLIPTLMITAAMFIAAFPAAPGNLTTWLHAKPLPFWIMTWFLVVAVTLTIVGTFFRGAGWAWVWPW